MEYEHIRNLKLFDIYPDTCLPVKSEVVSWHWETKDSSSWYV